MAFRDKILMKILQPAHKISAHQCESWKKTKEEALKLREYIRSGEFKGEYKSAYAISHAQVSTDPLHLFVINEDLENGFLRKAFGSWCVMNLKIVRFEELVSFSEACMSFPFRKPKQNNRMKKIRVEYYIPFLWSWRKVKKSFEGLPAFICQHENDHAAGKNIYFDS